MVELDARGLACPAPVLETKATVENRRPAEISVIVDNPAAKENVSRFLASRGYTVEYGTKDGDTVVVGRNESEGTIPEKADKPERTHDKKIMIMVSTDRLGFGDDELGLKLMANFIKTLKEMGSDLWHLVFVNNGVKLSVKGSDVLADLKAYEDDGLTILVCGTCLNHFNLLDKKQVGQTTNMLDIVTAMQVADKVISI
jgi:selenium metabolism protein YedF